MSDAPTRTGDSMPAWISAGILGVAIGAGGTYLAIQTYAANHAKASVPSPTMPPGGAMGSGTPPSMAMGGAGMGGMMGGGMGGMMGGGGGGAKRSLTSLVGKLELLSRPDLNLHLELDPEQAKKLAADLKGLKNAEKMSADEADDQLAKLEAVLTDEQKNTLSLVGLPPPARSAGGGSGGPPGGGGRPGGSGGGGPPAMGGMGGPPPDENPFTQETNQKRLTDLLARLSPDSAPDEAEPAKTDAAKTDTAEGTTSTESEK